MLGSPKSITRWEPLPFWWNGLLPRGTKKSLKKRSEKRRDGIVLPQESESEVETLGGMSEPLKHTTLLFLLMKHQNKE